MSGPVHAPRTLPLNPPQPMPVGLLLITTSNSAGPTTAIGRTWRPEDVPRCRLCPERECTVNEAGTCLVQVAGRVDPRDAALFSLVEWRKRLRAAAEGGVR